MTKDERIEEVAAFMLTFQKEHGHPATLREIMDGTSAKSTSNVSLYIQDLIAEKRVVELPVYQRRYRCVGEAKESCPTNHAQLSIVTKGRSPHAIYCLDCHNQWLIRDLLGAIRSEDVQSETS
jgi:SOS-response transcriptional repressor LexA